MPISKSTASVFQRRRLFSEIPWLGFLWTKIISADERREIIVGHSRAKRLLLVCFTEREDGRVRIVSARRATRKEQHDYEDHVTP